MLLVSVYTRADAQSYGSKCMALGFAFGVCHIHSVYTLASAQEYGSRCMASVHTFGVSVYTG